MWNTIRRLAEQLWDQYFSWVEPFFPILQWGIAIGAGMMLLSVVIDKTAGIFRECPNCKGVVPKTDNPCRKCGFAFEDSPAPTPPAQS